MRRRGIGQFHLEPEFHTAGSNQGRRQVAQVHGGHHDADAGGVLAFQTVQHGQEVAVQAALFAVFEYRIGIVDEDDRWRVVSGRLEHPVDTAIEIIRVGNEGAVNQKELAAKPVRQRPADGGFAGARRTIEQHAALGPKGQIADGPLLSH
jgi:hypothetical protein